MSYIFNIYPFDFISILLILNLLNIVCLTIFIIVSTIFVTIFVLKKLIMRTRISSSIYDSMHTLFLTKFYQIPSSLILNIYDQIFHWQNTFPILIRIRFSLSFFFLKKTASINKQRSMNNFSNRSQKCPFYVSVL